MEEYKNQTLDQAKMVEEKEKEGDELRENDKKKKRKSITKTITKNSFSGKDGRGEGEGGGRVEGEHRGEQRGVRGQHPDEEEADTEQYKGKL